MNEMPVQSAGLTRTLADFACSFSIRSAPAVAIQNAKLAILDCLGVSVLAVSQEVGRATLAFARENSGQGPCTVWGTAITTSARDAAFCNGVLAHGLDYDDRNHSSTFTLAVATAVAEQHDLPGAKVLEAFIVGREVRNSLDKLFSERGSGIGPGAKGWHSNGILGAIAAACAAAHAIGLDEKTALAAIGLAAGSCGALTRDGGTMAKPFRTGHSAATGLTCALLAKNGFSSDETALEGRFGLLDALSPIPDAALHALGKNLGEKFHLESPIKIKPFASCTATHSATEAMLRLRQGAFLRSGVGRGDRVRPAALSAGARKSEARIRRSLQHAILPRDGARARSPRSRGFHRRQSWRSRRAIAHAGHHARSGIGGVDC